VVNKVIAVNKVIGVKARSAIRYSLSAIFAHAHSRGQRPRLQQNSLSAISY
jgi:hypothetical protein